MKPRGLRAKRQRLGWSQTEAARRLGVSQAYLSMLETGRRRLTPTLGHKFMRVYGLAPTVLSTPDDFVVPSRVDSSRLARQLAALGYPRFAYLRTRVRKRNPAEVLLEALAQDDLEARLVEALPWLLLQYWDMDFAWLVEQAKRRDLQNRLGFVVSLARRVSERADPPHRRRNRKLAQVEATLDRSRLAREDTLGRTHLTDRERQWLLESRPKEARYWNLLTDWRAEHLPYAA